LTVIAVVAAAALFAGCRQKAAEGPSAGELQSEIGVIAAELNTYMSGHNFANTDAGAIAGEIRKLAGKYGELEKRAQEMKSQSGDEQYGYVAGLAGEGRAKAEALAGATSAGAPMGDADKAAALNAAIDGWAGYSDKVGAAPGEAASAEGEKPGVGEPAEPGVGEPATPEAPGKPGVGEPGGPPGKVEPVPPGTPRYPGKGHHYGWWKNPEWARDRGTRPLGEGEVPGAGEKERGREREHVTPGGGKRTDKAPGGKGRGGK